MSFDNEELNIIIIGLKLYELKQKDTIEVLRKSSNPWNKKLLKASERILGLTKQIIIDIHQHLSREGR